ncbi:TVP38/TMEM64 family protein, partial [Candidatus Poribacteria bacterium]|nr:TVP38/TMEM64 family protein [Candidatus Poribacteria bacterium]
MSKKRLRNLCLLLVISITVFVIILYFVQIQNYLGEFVSAFSSIETAREYIAGFGIFAPLISALLMIFQSVIAPLPAFLITIANG